MTRTLSHYRHTGMDASIQSQGCEAVSWDYLSFKLLAPGKLPSMALDSGIHAGMTAFFN